MSLDGMSLKEARKLLDTVKEKLELVLSPPNNNRDSGIITNGNSNEKIQVGNTSISAINNQNGQNGESKKETDSQQPKEDGKGKKNHIIVETGPKRITWGQNFTIDKKSTIFEP